MEVDGWTIYRIPRGEQRGNINIIRVNCESLAVDGVLYIPSRIGGHDIHGFGRPGHVLYAPSVHFSIPDSFEIERIVLAAELHVGHSFWRNVLLQSYPPRTRWGLRYVEFLCQTFERIHVFGGGGSIAFIIPDSTRGALYDITSGGLQGSQIYEKSEWIARQNNQ